jgi:dolichol-phosphate mannosyltransferase
MKLSIVIPAYNEEESIAETIDQIEEAFSKVTIEHEIYVVNDNSKDNTLQVLEQLAQKYPSLTYGTNLGPNGFGYAVRYGLERFSGDCVAVTNSEAETFTAPTAAEAMLSTFPASMSD